MTQLLKDFNDMENLSSFNLNLVFDGNVFTPFSRWI